MLTRRKLLTRGIQAGLMLGTFAFLPACNTETEPEAPSGPSLLDYAQQMTAISYLGPSCADRLSDAYGRDKAGLQESLHADLSGTLGANTGADSLGSGIDAAIRADFEAGRTMDVDGWQLSETECKLAALAALAQGIDEATAPPAQAVAAEQFVEVIDWGPKTTSQGQTFNEQPDGHSGIWIKAPGAPASTVLVFAGQVQATQIYEQSMTSGIHGKFMHEVINSPGTYSLELLDQAMQLKQPLGEFIVKPSAEAAAAAGSKVAKCPVKGWGPEYGFAGVPFNEQPGGRSAFWVRASCALPGSYLLLDGEPLATTVYDDGLLTASVPWGHELEAGLHELEIAPGGADSRFKIGTFRVEP